MPVTSFQNDPRIYAGQIVLENLTGDGQVDVRDRINADITAFIPAGLSIPVSVAYWGAAIKITEYDISAVKLITGFPLRAQFGSINYYSVVEIQQVVFIQNEVQYFKGDRCIVLPEDYQGAEFVAANLPLPTLVGSFSTASGFTTTQGISGITDFVSGATGLYYSLTPSVIATLNISYLGRINEGAVATVPPILTFLNY